MQIDLSQKVVAITGASSGIGEATALAAVEAGAAVALAARRSDRIEALAQRITDGGGQAIAFAADVGEEDQANAFVTDVKDRLGRLDALVNNAGVMLLGPIPGAPTEEWRRMVHVNLFGVLYCTHAALPIMLAQDGPARGHIVNVSSVAGRRASAGSGVYNLTKFGVNAFSEALRQEVAEQGVRVTIVEPGAVETELVGHNRDEIKALISDRIAEVEPMAPADIANAIVYALGQPPNVGINEILVRPTKQVR
jgi:clavulanate-9-aldehyde reductase